MIITFADYEEQYEDDSIKIWLFTCKLMSYNLSNNKYILCYKINTGILILNSNWYKHDIF